MAVAYLCERHAPDGAGPAVLKVVRPGFVKQAMQTALLTVRKEAVALGRLNETIPPTPFVVRFIENGELPLRFGNDNIVLPWLAMEYVNGSTLEDRVHASMRETGAAFDVERTMLCVDAIASGLEAVHAVKVLHRDIKPNNVLCCGVFPDEVFKLSDFGVARPVGLRHTFMEGSMGTPGYASPEQVLMDEPKIGPASDVFSFAATVFNVMTGQELFGGHTVIDFVQLAQRRERRSIRESPHLCDELRQQPSACAAIDSAISHATAPDARDRPQSARIFASSIIAALRPDSRVAPIVGMRRHASPSPAPANVRYSWIVRQAASDLAIRSVAWDGSGACLAATTNGLVFWTGTEWMHAPLESGQESSVRFVHRVSPGRWLIGGQGGFFAHYGSGEAPQQLRRPREAMDFVAASGLPEDLCAVFGSRPGQPPLLLAMSGRRWLRELPLTDVSFLLGLSRLDEERWLVAGRRQSGRGFVALYAPLRWEIEALSAPPVRVYTACATTPEVSAGIVVGAEGRVLRLTDRGIIESAVGGGFDLSAVTLEVNQRAWTSSLGRIWMQTPNTPDRWTVAWEDQRWQVPIVSLFADGRRIIGVAADGAVVEGCEL